MLRNLETHKGKEASFLNFGNLIMLSDGIENKPSLIDKVCRKLIGPPRDIHDSSIFRKITLIPLLAWIGLGADGLSSSAYGPEEAFKALGEHTYLAIFLAIGTALTVFIISYAYSRIIEHFPHGGGGYVVATHTLGEKAGVISGCALLVDYMLTITVSIAACGDALFSFLPMKFYEFKLPFDFFLIVILIILNLRGVKESVTLLAPIFLTFIVTHIFMLGYGIFSHVDEIQPITQGLYENFQHGLSALGGMGMVLLFLHAYSLGGGTYTGIEAVSNGLQMMREPRVRSGKRTMLYMSTSLAFVAGGLFIIYLLLKVSPIKGQTLNAVLAGSLFGQWYLGHWIALITILSEGALLFVAAQTGFIDGPRVMANMAIDSWFPHRFIMLSERLSMQNGVLLMGGASLLLLLYTQGSISHLIVMYSINVFATFSLSQLGMSRFFVKHRKIEKEWKKHLPIHLTGLTLCLTILITTVIEKFEAGGWITLLITSMMIWICYLIRGHYTKVRMGIQKLDKMLLKIPTIGPINYDPLDPQEMTAVLLVSGFNGFGIHSFLSIVRNFPNLYKNIIFVSIGIIDSGSFKGAKEIDALKTSVEVSLKKYVDLARRLGFRADYRFDIGTEVVEGISDICKSIAEEFSRMTAFTGKLIFHQVSLIHKLLHNERSFAIQRRLQWDGITTVILPIRVRI
jgi:amino acid transporter